MCPSNKLTMSAQPEAAATASSKGPQGGREKPDYNEWESTVCGRVYKHLVMAHGKNAVKVKMEKTTTHFEVKDERCSIYTMNRSGGVGARYVQLQACVEQWQVNQFPWWKEALLATQCQFQVLPLALSPFALSKGVQDAAMLFNVDQILQAWGIPPDASQKRVISERRIELQIKTIYQDDLAALGFNIVDQMGQLRLVPASLQAGSWDQVAKILDSKAELLKVSLDALRKELIKTDD